MRKGQKKILERANKYGLDREAIELLSREDFTIKQLDVLLSIFKCLKGIPHKEALEMMNNVMSDNFDIYDLYVRDVDRQRVITSYEDYLRLPEPMRDGKVSAWDCAQFRSHLRKKDQGASFYKFAEYYTELIKTYGKQELSLDTIGYYLIPKNNYRWSWDVKYNLDRDFAIFCVLVVNRLVPTIEKKEDAIADLKQEMTDISDSFKRRNYHTIDEKQYYETLANEYRHRAEICSFDRRTVYAYVFKYYLSSFYQLKVLYKQGRSVDDAVSDILSQKKMLRTKAGDLIEYPLVNGFNIHEHFDLKDKIYEEIKYESEEDRVAIENILNNTTLNATFSVNCYKVIIKTNEDNNPDAPIYIDFYHASRLGVHTSSYGRPEIHPHYCNYHDSEKFILFGNGMLFKLNNRTVPARIDEFSELLRRFDNTPLNNTILSIPAISESYVVKDLIRECKECRENNLRFPPILWNDCIGYKNRNHMMKDKYKNGRCIDWNKLGISRGYAYMKTRDYVDERSQGILYNAITNNIIKGHSARGRLSKKYSVAQNVVGSYLANKLVKKDFTADDKTALIEIEDYVRNSLESGQKLNLRWNSIKKVEAKNHDIVLANANKKTKKIIVPKDTVFEPLSKTLPSNFEWIRDRDRIIAEGQMMRHCVASYAGFVNEDKCAIYHLTYNDRHYTIEFVVKGSKYIPLQVQSKADRGAPKEVWDYIEEQIKDIKATAAKTA